MDDETEVLLRTRLFDAESALAELVRLKDGPRDSPYEQAKLLAWSRARAVLAQRPEDHADLTTVDVTWYYGVQQKYTGDSGSVYVVRPEGEGQHGLTKARRLATPADGDVVVGQRVYSMVEPWVPVNDDGAPAALVDRAPGSR